MSGEVTIVLTEDDAKRVVEELRDRMHKIYESPKNYPNHDIYCKELKKAQRLLSAVERQFLDHVAPLIELRPEQQEVAKTLNYFYRSAPTWLGRSLEIEEKLLLQEMLVYMRFDKGTYEDHAQHEQYGWSKRVLEHPDIDQF